MINILAIKRRQAQKTALRSHHIILDIYCSVALNLKDAAEAAAKIFSISHGHRRCRIRKDDAAVATKIWPVQDSISKYGGETTFADGSEDALSNH